MIKKCINCMKPFEMVRGTAQRCPECQKDYVKKYCRNYWEKYIDTRPRKCRVCGTTFRATERHQLACDDRVCRMEWKRMQDTRKVKNRRTARKKYVAKMNRYNFPITGIWNALLRG